MIIRAVFWVPKRVEKITTKTKLTWQEQIEKHDYLGYRSQLVAKWRKHYPENYGHKWSTSGVRELY